MKSTTHSGTALITGGSSGIGSVYADRLARRGYDLILAGRDQQRLESSAAKLRATGRRVSTIAGDLTRRADVKAIEQKLLSDPDISLFLNNAGTAVLTPLVESDPDALDQMLEVNVMAFTRLAVAAAKAFARQGRGTLINISSAVALAPDMLNGVYNGSKAYELSVTQALQIELAGKGVQIQAVLPGAVATEIWARGGRPVEQLPQEIVMPVESAVDAALAGLDQGELVTILSLPDIGNWDAYVAARKVLRPNLSLAVPAARYSSGSAH
jgi:short-subunit dehydrogenase